MLVLDPVARDFVEGLLWPDYNWRRSAQQALAHGFFTDPLPPPPPPPAMQDAVDERHQIAAREKRGHPPGFPVPADLGLAPGQTAAREKRGHPPGFPVPAHLVPAPVNGNVAAC